jgi:hypothetical protein
MQLWLRMALRIVVYTAIPAFISCPPLTNGSASKSFSLVLISRGAIVL